MQKFILWMNILKYIPERPEANSMKIRCVVERITYQNPDNG